MHLRKGRIAIQNLGINLPGGLLVAVLVHEHHAHHEAEFQPAEAITHGILQLIRRIVQLSSIEQFSCLRQLLKKNGVVRGLWLFRSSDSCIIEGGEDSWVGTRSFKQGLVCGRRCEEQAVGANLVDDIFGHALPRDESQGVRFY